MGHDIRAEKENVPENLHEIMELQTYDKDWANRYDLYRALSFAAELRRSAGDPANRVIYEALNAREQYASVSGNGDRIEYNRSDLELAIAYIKFLEATQAKIERPENFADQLFAMIGGDDEPELSSTDYDLGREMKFLKMSLLYMDVTGKDTIAITFG